MFEGNPVVAAKGVLVKEWNGGRSGSLMGGGAFVASPTEPEALRLKEWWAQGGSSQKATALSQSGPGAGGARLSNAKAVTLAELRLVAERLGEKTEIFSCVSRLSLVQTRKQGEAQPLQYMACQEPRDGSTLTCNRRLDTSGYCAACGRNGKAAARMFLRCRYADFTDSTWLTTFHEGAQQVIDMKAEDVRAMEMGTGENSGREALEDTLQKRYFRQPMQLTVRARLETYQGEQRPNVSCIDARPVPWAEHGRVLLKEVQEMLAA